jgi:DNA-binding NarL/FixJ family response regulator
MSQTGAQLSAPLRVMLVDDHALFRQGVRGVIDAEPDMRVVAEAGSCEEAAQRARALTTEGLDLVLMDISMPDVDGITTTKRLLEEHPGLRVIMLTDSTHDDDLFAAIEAGAVGFLNKNLAPPALVRTLRAYQQNGELPMSPTMAARLLPRIRDLVAVAGQPTSAAVTDERTVSDLTPREQQVLELVAQGAHDRDVAEQLVLSATTAKTHMQNILKKLGARTRAEAVARWRGDLLGRPSHSRPDAPGPARLRAGRDPLSDGGSVARTGSRYSASSAGPHRRAGRFRRSGLATDRSRSRCPPRRSTDSGGANAATKCSPGAARATH